MADRPRLTDEPQHDLSAILALCVSHKVRRLEIGDLKIEMSDEAFLPPPPVPLPRHESEAYYSDDERAPSFNRSTR